MIHSIEGSVVVNSVSYEYVARVEVSDEFALSEILTVQGPRGPVVVWDKELDPQPTEANVLSQEIYNRISRDLAEISAALIRKDYEYE